MKNYLSALKEVLECGRHKGDRTGTGTVSLEGIHRRYPLLREGTPILPVVTTKKVHMPAVIHELLWFISGETNIKYLNENNVKIWDGWANDDGELGPVYGKQWRDFNGVDQLREVIRLLREEPDSRRILLSAWNPEVLPDSSIEPKQNPAFGLQALPPCHTLFQFTTQQMSMPERLAYITQSMDMEQQEELHKVCHKYSPNPDLYALNVEGMDEYGVPSRYLSCHLYQRSGDMFLGVPFNIASYSLLTHMVAQCVGMVPLAFNHYIADAHIYYNHLDQVEEQLSREPKPVPRIYLETDTRDIEAFKYEDINIVGYNHHPAIKAPVAV